jgi:hypothetical protein
LAGEERIDGALVDAQNAADADRIEAAVVDETTNRLGMDAELAGDLTDAVERFGRWLRLDRGHDQSRFTPK